MTECEFEKDGKCYANNCFSSKECRGRRADGEPNFVTKDGELITSAERLSKAIDHDNYYTGWLRGTGIGHGGR